MDLRFAAIILADPSDDAHFVQVSSLIKSFDHPTIAHKAVVLPETDAAISEVADATDTQVLIAEAKGVVDALRTGLTNLPLLDAVYVANTADEQVACLTADQFATMANAYAEARLSLKRILYPEIDGVRHWPWLIDIGFRQPFVELSDDTDPASVLDMNPEQVLSVTI